MQNKSSIPTSLKHREDAGWLKVHQQLDMEMPVKKERNKKIFWIFLFAGLGLGGVLWSTRSALPSTNKSGIQTLISSDSLQETPDLKNTIEQEKAMALKEDNKNVKPEPGKLTTVTSEAAHKSQSPDLAIDHKSALSSGKHATQRKSKTFDPRLVSSIKPSPSDHKNLHTTKNPVSDSKHIEMIDPIQEDSKNNTSNAVAADQSVNSENNLMENKTFSSQNMVPVAYLPYRNATLSTGNKSLPTVSFSTSTDFQKTNTLVDLKKSKPSLFFLQGAATLQDANYLSSSFAPGMSIHVGSRWTINTMVGIGYQCASDRGTTINTGNTQNLSAYNLDAVKSAVYTQSSTQIFLEKNGMTRLSNGSLYISASDRILYTQSAHYNLTGQSSLSYAISSRWFVESGIYFHKALSKNYNQIIVQSAALNNSGSLNSQITSSRFNVETPDIPFDFHFIFQAGYRINRKIDLSLSYAPSSFSTIYPGNNKLYAEPSTVPQPSSVSAFVLPDTDGTSFARFAIRYHL